LDERFFEGANLKAKILGKLMDGPSNQYKLKEDLDVSENAIHKQLQILQQENIVTIEGDSPSGRGGARPKRKVALSPDVDVRIATQPVKLDGKDVVLQITWGRIGPGSVYPKQIVCLRQSENQKHDF